MKMNPFLNATRPIAPILLASLLCLSPLCACAAEEEDNPRKFKWLDSVALFEVLHARELAEAPAGSDRDYPPTHEVLVAVLASHHFKAPKEPIRLYLRIIGPYIPRRGGVNSDDWFPTEKGARFVACFNANQIGEVKNWKPFYNKEKVDEIWHQCTVYWGVVSRPTKRRPAALVKAIEREKEQLGVTFFELVK